MGFFYLARKGTPKPPAVWWRAHARHGFHRLVELTIGAWEMQLAGKLNGLGPHRVQHENGDFAACTGVFFYRDNAFEAGLDGLLRDFDGKQFPWTECRGHFAVIVSIGGRLWLANDELGAYKLYRDAAGTRFSSSFTAIGASFETVSPDFQGVYEYAFNGATYGDKTFLREVRQQRHGCLISLENGVGVVATAPVLECPSRHVSSLDAAAEEYASRLRRLFKTYARTGGGFNTALSGGYDSRLMLALLLDAGLDPKLYVYGKENDDDVRVAKLIAAGEGLSLIHVDKSTQGKSPDDRGSAVECAWVRFDGWKNEGLFDNGADAEDRLRRAPAGVFVLNGSVGESFRNFFYLPEGRYTPEELVWSFYWRIDHDEITDRFEPTVYTEWMSADMRSALPSTPTEARLERWEVEALYPLHRARYWTARDTSINQRFGPLLFPFMEPRVIAGTEHIPIAYKDYGRLESLITQRIYPRLSRYPTVYGFVPAKGPPAWYRAKMQLSLRRPPWLRRFSYLVHRRRRPQLKLPDWLDEGIRATGLDPRLPKMSEFFRVGRIRSLDMYNRVATMELALRDIPASGSH